MFQLDRWCCWRPKTKASSSNWSYHGEKCREDETKDSRRSFIQARFSLLLPAEGRSYSADRIPCFSVGYMGGKSITKQAMGVDLGSAGDCCASEGRLEKFIETPRSPEGFLI